MREYDSINFAQSVTTIDYSTATLLKYGKVEREDGTLGKALPRLPKVEGISAEE